MIETMNTTKKVIANPPKLFPGELDEVVHPQAQIQACIGHLIRNSLNLASWKDRKESAATLKPVCRAAIAQAAADALDAFAQFSLLTFRRRRQPLVSLRQTSPLNGVL